MNTTENNKLLAEFIGVNNITSNVLRNALLKDLNYDNDWNELMQVVDKCSLKADEMNADSMFRAELWMFVTNDIGSVYNACIKFIKWYNENSAKEN